MAATEFKIIDDPSNPSFADVIHAFVHAFYPLPFKGVVRFVVSNEGNVFQLALQPTSIAYDPEGPGRLLLDGNAVINNISASIEVHGYYNTHSRTGYFRSK